MNTLLLVHHQAEFRASLDVTRHINDYIRRHNPRIIQLVRGIESGPAVHQSGGTWYESMNGELPSAALAQLRNEYVTVAGGNREECINNTLAQLDFEHISYRVFRKGVYPRQNNLLCKLLLGL